MSVKERIKEFAKYKKISIREFERLSGLNYGYVNAIRVSLQPDKIESIASHFDDLNIEWLLTGEGYMLKNAESQMTGRLSLLTDLIEKQTPFLVKRGYDKDIIHSQINKDTQTRNELIGDLVEIDPRININWLLTGKGEMLSPQKENLLPEIESPKEGKKGIDIIDSLFEIIEKQQDDLSEIKSTLKKIESYLYKKKD